MPVPDYHVLHNASHTPRQIGMYRTTCGATCSDDMHVTRVEFVGGAKWGRGRGGEVVGQVQAGSRLGTSQVCAGSLLEPLASVQRQKYEHASDTEC